MSENSTDHGSRITDHDSSDSDEINLLNLAIVLAKNKLLILGLPLLTGVVAAIISLLMTEIYTGTTKIMPPLPGQSSSAAATLSQISGLTGGIGGAIGMTKMVDLYIGMLRSRTISDRIVERFDLMRVYEVKRLSDARVTLAGATNFSVGKDGLITIEVSDKDRKLGTAMANAYVEELVRLTGMLAVTEAAQRRLFFQKQLEQAKANLTQAELAARSALRSGGIAMVDAQGKSMVETSANLRAQIAAKEVEINSMRGFATERNPQFLQARQELAALQSQISKLEGNATRPSADDMGKTGELGLKNVTLLRNVKYHEVLFDLLVKQYESAKLDEAREGAVIQVVDKALEPEYRTHPKRTRIVLVSMVIAGFIAIFIAFVREALNRARADPQNGARLGELRRYLSWRG